MNSIPCAKCGCIPIWAGEQWALVDEERLCPKCIEETICPLDCEGDKPECPDCKPDNEPLYDMDGSYFNSQE